MNDDRTPPKPSETAFMAALRRTIANYEFKHDRLGADYLAATFLDNRTRTLIKYKFIRNLAKTRLNKFMPGIYEFVIARSAYFDSVFIDALNRNYTQIVILGAGFDTRALRFARLIKDTLVFEVDKRATQNYKIDCLKRDGIEIPAYLQFVPANLNLQPLLEVLEKAGYQHGEKTLFLWEGVTYYLEPEAVNATLEGFRGSVHPDSMIVFDYVVPVNEANADKFYGAQRFLESMSEYHAEERMTFAIEDGALETYLHERRLEVVNHMDNLEIEEAFLTREDDTLVGKVTGHFRLVLASPSVDEGEGGPDKETTS